jgi:hypothetical protein
MIENNKKNERVEFGGEDYLDVLQNPELYKQCDDCGVKLGEYHRSGCDNEICFVCSQRLVECDCEINEKERKNA